MGNVIELYESKPTRSELGSFAADRRSFGHHGDRRDTRVNNAAVALVKEAHDDFGQNSTREIASLLSRETLLGSLSYEGYQFQVHIRKNGKAVIAFYSHATDEGYTTYLMGVEANPPISGQQDWWRSVIKSRLEELLE